MAETAPAPTVATLLLKLQRLLKVGTYLTRTEEKKGRPRSPELPLKVTIRVSLTFLRSDLERLVLSFSRAETCLSLREEGKKRM